jgi:Domain of unknown function DUF29
VKTAYEADVVAWANEQAKFIRAGQFDQLDLIHLAEEIEDVGKSEQRELASRMAVLLAHLLKWQYQPDKQSKSWQHTIRTQRKAIAYALVEAPSLRPKMEETRWLDLTWDDAVRQAIRETGLDIFPETCPWSMTDALQEGWLPVTH